MIGFLKGIVSFIENDSIILNVKDVGYHLFIPLYFLQDLKVGDSKEFFVHTHVKENALDLYGFSTFSEKDIFTLLLSVGGIGPKLALTIVSYSNGPKNIIKAIKEAQVDFFESIKGIGKKAAQRIIVDLKSKLGGLKELEFEGMEDVDLIEALKGLGFENKEIKKAVKGIKKDLPLEEKIRLSLKE
ncbi:Holliday junction branch migration protein RuvA [Candidatus Beckwithbacteria bacterium CG10_big_fil_rev_8_21_14_0_10_34_10]|uniref:Holliday junction branch migration complex subunit RuvA n=1 Tax=Candidatus Beckwithbacteria bacterium CG10_big_fil_rev_8_21_14_0_10_34_10 TaxID=1974495 RepID=A0A2H0WCG2_9BACT|nr:MAG: Holliday junction branch migration protein RuvA [Candidatus Beckwithbacteria bacterium CG10_big_fil_rev_8_21_14_0_10_34_10]